MSSNTRRKNRASSLLQQLSIAALAALALLGSTTNAASIVFTGPSTCTTVDGEISITATERAQADTVLIYIGSSANNADAQYLISVPDNFPSAGVLRAPISITWDPALTSALAGTQTAGAVALTAGGNVVSTSTAPTGSITINCGVPAVSSSSLSSSSLSSSSTSSSTSSTRTSTTISRTTSTVVRTSTSAGVIITQTVVQTSTPSSTSAGNDSGSGSSSGSSTGAIAGGVVGGVVGIVAIAAILWCLFRKKKHDHDDVYGDDIYNPASHAHGSSAANGGGPGGIDEDENAFRQVPSAVSDGGLASSSSGTGIGTGAGLAAGAAGAAGAGAYGAGGTAAARRSVANGGGGSSTQHMMSEYDRGASPPPSMAGLGAGPASGAASTHSGGRGSARTGSARNVFDDYESTSGPYPSYSNAALTAVGAFPNNVFMGGGESRYPDPRASLMSGASGGRAANYEGGNAAGIGSHLAPPGTGLHQTVSNASVNTQPGVAGIGTGGFRPGQTIPRGAMNQ